MPAKKKNPVPVAGLLSDTALRAPPSFEPAEAEALSGGLLRTLARKRDGLDAPTTIKASALAKSDASGRLKPATGARKANIGPRSGHK